MGKLSVGGQAVIDDGDGLVAFAFFGPVVEDVSKLVVGDDDMLIDVCYTVDVVNHASKNGVVANLEQWFWKVFCQLTQSCGVAGGNNDIFHLVLLLWVTTKSLLCCKDNTFYAYSIILTVVFMFLLVKKPVSILGEHREEGIKICITKF